MNNEDILKRYLKEVVGLSDHRISQEFNGLVQYDDIFNEFIDYIKNGWKQEEQMIHVEGYNAKILNEKYPLSVLGSFNYLIYLRESPTEALFDLKNNLPRK